MQFNGKLIGIMDVPELKGDKMCFEAMQALKAEVNRRREHKPRIAVGVSFEGIAIHGAPTGVRTALLSSLMSTHYSLLLSLDVDESHVCQCVGELRCVHIADSAAPARRALHQLHLARPDRRARLRLHHGAHSRHEEAVLCNQDGEDGT